MKGTVTKSALACLVLKAGQQILHDLDPVVMDDTVADVARFATEQYACRLGSPLIAAYALDKAVSYIEEFVLPKSLRGSLPIALSTLGAAAALHYAGKYMNLPALNFAESAKYIFQNYADAISKITTLNPEINAGYLTLAALTLKSGTRLIKNIGQSIAEYSEEKRLKREQRKELEQLTENEK